MHWRTAKLCNRYKLPRGVREKAGRKQKDRTCGGKSGLS
jgi:hypothetical protein